MIAAIMLLGLQVIVPQVPLGVVGLSVGVMGALQYTSAWFRLRVEVAGYGASYKVDPENITKFATALSNSYKLGVSVNECKRLIKSHAGRLF